MGLESLLDFMQPTANIWEVLCRDLESEKQAANAEQYHEIAQKFIESARQMLRADSPRLCDAIEIAGDISQAAGQFPDAMARFEEAYSLARLHNFAASSARLAAKLALLYDHFGNVQGARETYEYAISTYGDLRDHSQHVMLLNRLGALCKAQEDYAAAERHYEKAMQVASSVHGPNHPEVATAANNLGVTYTDLQNYERAENLHMQALAIREKSFGAMHPEVAQSMANLAVVYHASGKLDQARGFYLGALDIFKRFRPANDPEVQTVQANYDSLLKHI